jgi:hypothetical protein
MRSALVFSVRYSILRVSKQSRSNRGMYLMFPKPVLAPLPNELCWECVKVAKGEFVDGLLAGEVVQVACHWSGRASKPCRSFLSEGKIPCHCQEEPCSLRVVAYVPIINKARDKIVVPAAASVGHRLEGIKPGTPIRLARPDRDKKPLNVMILRPLDVGEDFHRRLHNAMCHDIHPYLLHLWQDPILSLHFGVEYRPANITPLMRPTDVTKE